MADVTFDMCSESTWSMNTGSVAVEKPHALQVSLVGFASVSSKFWRCFGLGVVVAFFFAAVPGAVSVEITGDGAADAGSAVAPLLPCAIVSCKIKATLCKKTTPH